jgi:hypothetical protein
VWFVVTGDGYKKDETIDVVKLPVPATSAQCAAPQVVTVTVEVPGPTVVQPPPPPVVVTRTVTVTRKKTLRKIVVYFCGKKHPPLSAKLRREIRKGAKIKYVRTKRVCPIVRRTSPPPPTTT